MTVKAGIPINEIFSSFPRQPKYANLCLHNYFHCYSF